VSASAPTRTAPSRGSGTPGLARTGGGRGGWFALTLLALAAVVLLSVAIGAKNIAPHTVLDTLFGHRGSDDDLIVLNVRLPRTVLGLLVGAALGVAGALIQAMTRNPLADPGILGVNAGASFFVVLAVGAFGLTSIWSYIWFAFLGAVLATVAVYLVGSAGRGGGSPVRLTLAGVALSAVLTGIGSGITLLDPAAFDQLRYWKAGSLAGRGYDIVLAVLPFLLAGLAVAVAISRSLNAVALGDELAAGLGVRTTRIRLFGVVAVTLLCGAATAAVGPVAFVGLMVPHVARWLIGPDQRWIVAFSAVLAPVLLLVSDVLGRLVARPGELQVGIVTAVVGAPVLIYLVRRKQASGL
jgi:iron complex transport system permease protein